MKIVVAKLSKPIVDSASIQSQPDNRPPGNGSSSSSSVRSAGCNCVDT